MPGRRDVRDWPTVPIPYFGLPGIYQAVQDQWPDAPAWSPRDPGLIRSALAEPFQTGFGSELYPTIPDKAACLFRGLVKNHGLEDGNKRLGVMAMGVFLVINGWSLEFSNTSMYRYALRVAGHHGDYPVPTIARWVRRHAKPLPAEQLVFARSWCERVLSVVPVAMHFLEDQRVPALRYRKVPRVAVLVGDGADIAIGPDDQRETKKPPAGD